MLKKTNEKGFTLIEISIAVLILGLALTTLIGLQTRVVDLYSYERNLTKAGLYAQYLMTHIELEKDPPEEGSIKESLSNRLTELGYFDDHPTEDIEKDKIKNLDHNFSNLEKINQITNHFIHQINKDFTIDLCGHLMNEYWDIKKKLSKKVSNPFINELYKEGLNNGAIGGKIIGSGGGGFLLFCCKKNKQKKFLNGFKKLPIIKFKFTEIGSEIIFRNN